MGPGAICEEKTKENIDMIDRTGMVCTDNDTELS